MGILYYKDNQQKTNKFIILLLGSLETIRGTCLNKIYLFKYEYIVQTL